METGYLEAYRKAIQRFCEENPQQCQEVRKGRRVRVVKGRKVPIGTEGTAFWVGHVAYKPLKYQRLSCPIQGIRVGFKDDQGNTYWTAYDNLEVVNPEQYKWNNEEIEYEAHRCAKAYEEHGRALNLL